MIKNDNIVQSIIVANGEAAILDANGVPISYSNSFLNDNRIVVPNKYVDISRIQGIFVNSGIIRFEENEAFLNFVIQESRNRTIMSQLGKITEAVIVKRCSESEEINYELFCIATGKRAHRKTARQFEAIGTGLIDTSIKHKWHYNPKDTQRDIIFVNQNDIPALMSNVTSLAGQCAGLQVKTSNEIIDYILSDVVTVRYCVPIVCLSVMDFSLMGGGDFFAVNIYSELIRRIMVCGRADRGRGAWRSAAVVSESMSKGVFSSHGISDNIKNEKQQVCTQLCAACCFCVDYFVCTKLCPFLCFG